MSAHTPGGWEWVSSDNFGSCDLVGSDGTVIITAIGAKGSEEDDRLIAAAPDLLEALKAVISAESDYDYCGMSESEAAALEMVRAAIAKAEGKQ